MRPAADEAYRLDPLLAETSAARGMVQAHDLEWATSEESFKEALSRNRSLTWIHTDAVMHLLYPLGRFDEALELLEVAREADPKSHDVLRTLAAIQVEAGLYQEAVLNAHLVLDRDPTYRFVALRLGRALAMLGRYDEALHTFQEEPRGGLQYVGYVYAVTGRRNEAEAIARNVANGPADWAAATELMVYGGLGDKDRAFDALNRLVEINSWRAATWMLRPELKILRDDPRFDEIRRLRLRISK
jgi:tetratricopeptide (TPR) repeat protein